MDKRLTRTDYLFALMFIVMLVFILGAFFYGLKVGKQKSDQQYQNQVLTKAVSAKQRTAYDQQDLVSFYHTIYLSFREFQNKWFTTLEQMEIRNSTDSAAALKELLTLANDKLDLLEEKSMPDTSPLLQEAHQNDMKSLKLFADALKNFQPKANSMRGADLIAAMNKDAFIIEAKNYALKAQKNYFDSIVKWNQSVDSNLRLFDINSKATLTDWGQMNLNVKNVYVANLMLISKTFKPYNPQDLTLRLDDFITTGQAKKLNANDIMQSVDLLITTDAIRQGDFIKNKHKYDNQTLPQLPFFNDQP